MNTVPSQEEKNVTAHRGTDATRKPFVEPRLTPTHGGAALPSRPPFAVPEITEHDALPIITAGSVNLWQ